MEMEMKDDLGITLDRLAAAASLLEQAVERLSARQDALAEEVEASLGRIVANVEARRGTVIEEKLAAAELPIAELKARGADWIDASSGGTSPLQKIPTEPGYQVPFAKAVKQATGATTIAVGLITGARQAEEIVAKGEADLVALARGMLYDPRWGWHAAAELGGSVDAPPQYWRAPPHAKAGVFRNTLRGAR